MVGGVALAHDFQDAVAGGFQADAHQHAARPAHPPQQGHGQGGVDARHTLPPEVLAPALQFHAELFRAHGVKVIVADVEMGDAVILLQLFHLVHQHGDGARHVGRHHAVAAAEGAGAETAAERGVDGKHLVRRQVQVVDVLLQHDAVWRVGREQAALVVQRRRRVQAGVLSPCPASDHVLADGGEHIGAAAEDHGVDATGQFLVVEKRGTCHGHRVATQGQVGGDTGLLQHPADEEGGSELERIGRGEADDVVGVQAEREAHVVLQEPLQKGAGHGPDEAR